MGNLATSLVQRAPELFRAFAMKGAEIMLRTASGGFSDADVQASDLYDVKACLKDKSRWK